MNVLLLRAAVAQRRLRRASESKLDAIYFTFNIYDGERGATRKSLELFDLIALLGVSANHRLLFFRCLSTAYEPLFINARSYFTFNCSVLYSFERRL